MYYYSENDKKIQLINFEWVKNRKKNRSIEDVVASMSNKEKEETIYKQKFDYISNYLKGKLGEPDSSKSEKNGVEQKWTKDNKIVILEYSQRDVELTIYSE